MAMSVFNKKVEEAIAKAKELQEEWIWVEGYKGTNKYMTCRDYQFDMHRQFDMPEGAKIEDCKSGFHLCLNLKDVFEYYPIGNGNRFFRVRALVRKKDFDEYCLNENENSLFVMPANLNRPWTTRRDKLAARSIMFMYEMTADEILAAYDVDTSGWTEDQKNTAININVKRAKDIGNKNKLVELGYSEIMAAYFVDIGKFTNAVAAASQSDLSMDMRVLFVINSEKPSSEFDKLLAKLSQVNMPVLGSVNINASGLAGLYGKSGS